MSALLQHAYIAALMLLLAAFSDVHSWNKKSSSYSGESSLDPREEYSEGFTYNADETVRHRHQWSKSKEVLEKLPDKEDKKIVQVVKKEVNNKDNAFLSTKEDDDVGKESEHKMKTEIKLDQNKNKGNIRKRLKSQNNSSTHVSISNQKTSDASSNSAPEDFNLTDKSLPHLEDDRTNTWNTSSSVIDSSSQLRNNNSEPLLDSGCSTCRTRELDKHYRIMYFKQQILNTLQIKKLPNTTGVPIPTFPALSHLHLMNDEEMMSDSPYRSRHGYGNRYQDLDYDDDFVVKTERVFTAGKPASIGLHLNLTDSVYFPPSIQIFSSKIKTAHLWFYIRKHDSTSVLVTIERILPESFSENKILKKTIFSQKLIREKSVGWKRIDMRDTLRQWIRHPMSNFGLEMRAEDNSGNNLIVLPPTQDTDKGYEPWLDTRIIQPRSNSRRRRSESLLCVENSTDSRCCRHPLLVGFAEFGWNWIIAPTHVKADYCTGECRLTMQGTTPYSWVNQQMPGSNSCCAPTKLSPLPLLYFDESMNIVYQILQNMKVDKCGCA